MVLYDIIAGELAEAKESAGRGQYGGRQNKSEISLANVPEMYYNALKRESEGQASKADSFSAGEKYDKETEGIAYGTDIRKERHLPPARLRACWMGKRRLAYAFCAKKGGVQAQKMLKWLWFICAGMRLSQEGFRMTLFSMA